MLKATEAEVRELVETILQKLIKVFDLLTELFGVEEKRFNSPYLHQVFEDYED